MIVACLHAWGRWNTGCHRRNGRRAWNATRWWWHRSKECLKFGHLTCRGPCCHALLPYHGLRRELTCRHKLLEGWIVVRTVLLTADEEEHLHLWLCRRSLNRRGGGAWRRWRCRWRSGRASSNRLLYCGRGLCIPFANNLFGILHHKERRQRSAIFLGVQQNGVVAIGHLVLGVEESLIPISICLEPIDASHGIAVADGDDAQLVLART